MPKRSKEQWLQLFEQHAPSGLSANQFCKQNSVCAKSFSRRKKQLLFGVVDKEVSGQPVFCITDKFVTMIQVVLLLAFSSVFRFRHVEGAIMIW